MVYELCNLTDLTGHLNTLTFAFKAGTVQYKDEH